MGETRQKENRSECILKWVAVVVLTIAWAALLYAEFINYQPD